MRRGREITWNGTTAWYDPADLALCEEIARQTAAKEIPAAEGKNQLDVIHELKLLGAVNVTPPPEAEAVGVGPRRHVEQTSEQFQIPEKAVQQFELGALVSDPEAPLPRPPTELSGQGQARHTDPETAKEAARKVEGGNARHHLLWAFYLKRPQGLSPFEANALSGDNGGMEYATRCSELKRDGLIVPTGDVRTSPESNLSREVLAITPAGIEVAGRIGPP